MSKSNELIIFNKEKDKKINIFEATLSNNGNEYEVKFNSLSKKKKMLSHNM